jgi:uncharacterized protein (UPF0248 family)
MPVCIRCHKDTGFLGLLSFNKQTQRCGKCEQETQQALARFRESFLTYSTNTLISEEAWQYLVRLAQHSQLDLREALAYVRGDALHFLERCLTFFFADSIISPEEEQYVRTLLDLLAIPREHATPLLHRLNYLKTLTAIRQGHLPTIEPPVHLESDEVCHLVTAATFYKLNAKSVTHIPGRFVATNKRLHFLSQSGGSEIPWKRIMRIDRDANGVYLELSTKKGNGYYATSDPMFVEAVLETLVKISKRELLPTAGDAASRHIPHEVRIAVWQREQGKCVQCSSTTYLEFDHIIPFSKGGASTVNNVQLLCRRCNLAKGNRL